MSDDERLRITREVGLGSLPINGLRHPPERGTSGWYLWAGTSFPAAADAFQPTHAHHLLQRCPWVLPYLELAPGWRFLIAPGYEDVWFDKTLLDIG